MFFTRLNRVPRSFPDVNPVFLIFLYFYVPAVSRRPVSMPYYLHFQDFCQAETALLFFRKGSACCFLTVTGAAALDIHMIRHTLVIAVMNAFYSLTVDADRLAGMCDRTGKRIRSFSLVVKAFTAGVITIAGMFSCHHDISFTAQAILIIGTTFYDTFQICHISLTFCRSRRPAFFVTNQFVTGQKLHLQKRHAAKEQAQSHHASSLFCAVCGKIYILLDFYL